MTNLSFKKLIIYFSIVVIIFFLVISFFVVTNLKYKVIKIQLHSINEWITSYDLGYSSLFNITNDGTEKYAGNFNQPISKKILSLPIAEYLSINQIKYVTKTINEFYEKK